MRWSRPLVSTNFLCSVTALLIWHVNRIGIFRTSQRLYYAKGMLWRSFIFTVRLTVYANTSQKTALLKTPASHFVWTENILMMELFENDVDTIITRFFYWPSFPRTQIPNDRWLLVIVVRPAQWTETFDTFSEWNLRFPIGQFTAVSLVTWPWMQARLKVTLLWYRPLYFSHVNAK